MTAAVFEERIDPGKVPAAILAAAVHLMLLAVLVFGVSWQNRPPQSVQVEIWTEPVVVNPAPPPVIQPPPAPEPPRVAPPPEPPKIAKPDIVEKVPEKKKAPEKKAEPKPKPAPPPLKPRVDDTQKRIQEQLAREQAAFDVERERARLRELAARDAASASSKGLAEYQAKIRAAVRGNIMMPADIAGNPEAIFLVVQLPTGDVLSAKLVKSSGHRGYDQAVERAILKSSPLPKPDRPELFSRELRLTFRPKD
jgi:colicin import membrane protein